MHLTLPNEIDTIKLKQYLGYSKKAPSNVDDLRQMQDICSIVLQTATPLAIQRSISIKQASPLLQGENIIAHLIGCSQCLFAAITLGTQLDMLFRQLQTKSIAQAVIADAAASVLTEQLAEQWQQQNFHWAEQNGLFMTYRFSPGYGDYPLSVNPLILNLLEAPKKIGVFSTSTHLLTPRKSVTVVCGIADHPVKGTRAKCQDCALRETCPLKQNAEYCW